MKENDTAEQTQDREKANFDRISSVFAKISAPKPLATYLAGLRERRRQQSMITRGKRLPCPGMFFKFAWKRKD